MTSTTTSGWSPGSTSPSSAATRLKTCRYETGPPHAEGPFLDINKRDLRIPQVQADIDTWARDLVDKGTGQARGDSARLELTASPKATYAYIDWQLGEVPA
jgi:hypothetical protein